MRRKTNAGPPGPDLVRINRITGTNWPQLPSELFFYNILIIQNSCHYPVHQLYILGPGKAIHTFQHRRGIGYQVSIREEALSMLGCQHLEPFFSQTMTISHALLSHEKSAAELDTLVKKMENTSLQTGQYQTALLAGLLKVFLVYISRYFQNENVYLNPLAETEHLYGRFVGLLGRDTFQRKAVAAYASELSVSSNTLNGTIRKISGYTASHHIQQQVIRRAKYLAITSQANMKQVAYALGFHDLAHFSKYFRSNAGMTFSDFKRAFQPL